MPLVKEKEKRCGRNRTRAFRGGGFQTRDETQTQTTPTPTQMMTTQKSGRDDAVGGLDRLLKAVGQSVASPIPRLCLWRPSQASKAMAIDASRVSRDKKKAWGSGVGEPSSPVATWHDR